MLVGFVMCAQNTATISPSSDFKTIKDGFVVSVMTLDHELSAAQQQDIAQWASDNSGIIKITVAGKTVTTMLQAESNDRNVYDKMFMQMGVDHLRIGTGTKTETLSTSQFYDHFNL